MVSLWPSKLLAYLAAGRICLFWLISRDYFDCQYHRPTRNDVHHERFPVFLPITTFVSCV
jgi:hypothetical protein